MHELSRSGAYCAHGQTDVVAAAIVNAPASSNSGDSSLRVASENQRTFKNPKRRNELIRNWPEQDRKKLARLTANRLAISPDVADNRGETR